MCLGVPGKVVAIFCEHDVLMGQVDFNGVRKCAHTIVKYGIDPPEQWRDAAAGCRNVGTWPVLVGEAGEQDTLWSGMRPYPACRGSTGRSSRHARPGRGRHDGDRGEHRTGF